MTATLQTNGNTVPSTNGHHTVVDVDHHHDNSRFGDVNLIDGRASSTAEILSRVFDDLDVRLTPEIAEALYVGDMTVDIQTARAAGVTVWVAPTGSDPRQALEEAGPDRLLGDLTELAKWFVF